MSSKGLSLIDQYKSFIRQENVKNFIGEFIGIYTIIVFGCGVVGCSFSGLSFLSITIGWALGVFFGVAMTSKISGAHLNPAVTFSLFVFDKFSLKKTLLYILAQFLGAFFGAATIYLLFWGTINELDETRSVPYADDVGDTPTAGIFSTYPLPYVPNWSAVLNEIFATAVLLFVVRYIGDPNNIVNKASDLTKAAIVGLTVLGIGICFGKQTGYAINPARDFGPRVLTAIFYGFDVFSVRACYFWIPLVAPFIGGLLGSAVYLSSIALLSPDDPVTELKQSEYLCELNTPPAVIEA